MAAEIVMPRQTDGWVVVGRGRSDCHRETVGRTLPLLHGANLATLAIDLSPRIPVAIEQIRRRAERLRLELAEGLPVAYLGAGLGAGAGWAASVTGELDGVIAWNPRAGRARGTLRHVSVPSLLVVEAGSQLAWDALVARRLSWRLASRADVAFAEGSALPDAGTLARWYFEQLLSPTPVLRPRSRTATTRQRLVAGVAAAVVLPAALPAFANASTLSRAQIGGDGAIAAPRSPAPDRHRHLLYGSRILGDGAVGASPFATGSKALIDGAGVKYFINTDITFSTSSSASGAMSEASFTHAVSATTLNGGHTQSTLNDSYDGYNTLCISTNNTTGTCETGNANWDIYNKNGPAVLEDNGRQVDLPVQTIGALQVSRKVFIPSNDEFARWLNILTNTGSTPLTFTVAIANNLGSDSNTVIVNDSSSNTSPTAADTWVTTFQNYSGTTSSDPRLGHVLQGAGAPTPVSALSFANGDDNPWWDYSVTLQPGETKIIMNYGVVQPSKADAATKAAQLASLSDPHQLDLMSKAEESDVANFDIPPPSLSAVRAPSSGISGNPISASSISAKLTGGFLPSGTVKFKVFGPQSSPPRDCSGGTTVGSASANGDGTYHPTAGFTPLRPGDYWWYAGYGGDAHNRPADVRCGPSMNETIVVSSLIVGHATASGSTANVPLNCRKASSMPCHAMLTLLATDPAHSGHVVVVGQSTATLTAGQAQTVKVELNAEGKRLLAERHRLQAKVVVRQYGAVIATKVVTFR